MTIKSKILLFTLLLFALLPQIAKAQTEGPVSLTASGTCATVSTVSCAVMSLNSSQNTITFDILGASPGTNLFEFSPDNQVTWRALTVVNLVSLSAVTSTTAAGSFSTVNTNYTHVRVRMSVTGTNTTTIRASQNNAMTGVVFGGGGGTIGTVNQGTASASDYWLVHCDNCGGATLGQTTMSASLPVTMASNQSSFPVAATLTAETTKVIGTINVAASQTIATTNAGTFATQLTGSTNNINNVSGTISLPTGASTAANQSTIITSTQLLDNIVAPITPATATATGSVLLGGQYNSTPTTATTGQQGSLATTSHMVMLVNPADSTGAPLSLTADVTVDLDSSGGTQTAAGYPILVAASGGAVAITGDATNGLDIDVTRLPALVAGSAVIGQVSINQTTPGTTNLVQTVGANASPIIACNASVPIDTASSGNVQLVAISGSTVVYVCSFDVTAEATVDVRLIHGTGSACATGDASLSGTYAFSTTTGFLGISKGNGIGTIYRTSAGEALCIELGGAVQINGSVSYAQF